MIFRSPTVKEVLSRISREIGPDAVIISCRKIQDSDGKTWVEATAFPRKMGGVPERASLILKKTTARFRSKKLFIPALVFITLSTLILLSMFLIGKLPSGKSILPKHKQIVFTGNAYYPAISPDGKFFAYVNYETFDKQKVMVQDMVNGQEIEVFSGPEFWPPLQWLPDGSGISFRGREDGDLAIFVVPRLGGSVRRLEYATYHAWAPDGSRVAWTKPSWKKIMITNESSGESTSIPLKDSFIFINGIDWSPTGNFLLFMTIDDESHPAIWTISTEGTAQHKVVEDDAQLFSARWSPRGNAIFYFRGLGHLKELWKIPVSSDTGKPMRSASLVLPDIQTGNYFNITNDGSKLMYTQELRFANLWLATVDSSGNDQKVKIKQLTKGTLWNKNPSISPDGNLIAFRRGYVDSTNIYVMPIEGGSPKQITFFNSRCIRPVWSPDGTEIAFGSNEGGYYKVWKINAHGGTPFQFVRSQLSGRSTSSPLAWFPGENILYHRPGHHNFFILNPVTGEEKPLVQDDSVGWMFNPRYSPDGKKVAVMWNRRPSRVWVIPIEYPSQAFFLKENAYPVGWSADGRWIYAIEPIFGTLKILKISIKGEQTKILLNRTFTLEEGFPKSVSVTTDEKKFVFPVFKFHSDVWMVENFDPDMR